MDFSSFIALADSYKVYTSEFNISREIHSLTWTQHGVSTNTYYTTFVHGFPNRILERDKADDARTEYVERFSIAEVDSNAGSFYYDLPNQILYVHTTNTYDPSSDTDDVYNYTIVANYWVYIANAQFDDSSVILPRVTEALTNGKMEAWSSATDLDSWTETLAGISTVNREASAVQEGGYCVRFDIDGSNSNASIYQDIILPPGSKCVIKLYKKMTAAGVRAEIVIRDSGSNVYLASTGLWQAGATSVALSNATSWTEFELEFYANENYSYYRIYIGRRAATSESIHIDNARLSVYREDNYYLPYLTSGGVPPLIQGVDDFYSGAMRFQYGTHTFVNDGYFYDQFTNAVWHNKVIVDRYGKKGASIDDFEVIFTGRTKSPSADDTDATIDVVDNKVLLKTAVPLVKFWESNYSNLEEGAEGKPIPYVYGEFDAGSIIPVCIDTVNFVYKICDHALEDITSVEKDGVTLTITTDYTVDLANGQFTLLVDPIEAVITCGVQGKKCDLSDGTYSYNVADIFHSLLVDYGGVDKTKIDYHSLLDLKAGRSQKHHLYIESEKQINEVIKLLQASALFHVVPTNNGQFKAFRYKGGITALTPRLTNEDYRGFRIDYDTTSVNKTIRVRYNNKPSALVSPSAIATSEDVEDIYDETKTLVIDSTLKDKTEAENLAAFYLDLLQDPQRKIMTNIPTIGFNLEPGDKIVINKTRSNDAGEYINVIEETAYRIMETRKYMSNGRVDLILLEDLQSTGATYCEVCDACETCYTMQEGSCTVCVTCEKCDTGECSTCEACYYCEKCDGVQCTTCESCDSCELCVTCETCNTCEAAECSLCVTCEKCYTGECTTCMVCDSCEKCFSGECTTCQTCDDCEKCISGECVGCQICDSCEKCFSEECTICQVCDDCEKCISGECTTCESCNTCEAGECQICVDCETCFVFQN